MKRLATLAAALALTGCAHQLTVVPRDGGPPGYGTAPMKWVSNSGGLTISLDGKTYRGEYVYVPEGGTFGTLIGSSGGQVATGTVIGSPTSGGGLANLRAEDGSTLRCEFRFSSWSATGVGVCQNPQGRLFDLLIK